MADTILGNDLSYMWKCPTETLVTAFQVSKPTHISKKKLDLKILANLNPRKCGFRYIEAYSFARIPSVNLLSP